MVHPRSYFTIQVDSGKFYPSKDQVRDSLTILSNHGIISLEFPSGAEHDKISANLEKLGVAFPFPPGKFSKNEINDTITDIFRFLSNIGIKKERFRDILAWFMLESHAWEDQGFFQLELEYSSKFLQSMKKELNGETNGFPFLPSSCELILASLKEEYAWSRKETLFHVLKEKAWFGDKNAMPFVNYFNRHYSGMLRDLESCLAQEIKCGAFHLRIDYNDEKEYVDLEDIIQSNLERCCSPGRIISFHNGQVVERNDYSGK